MNTALDNATFYKKAVAAFDLPADKAEKIAAQMQALGVGRDDAYMLLFLATARAEALTETIPGQIEKAGERLLAGVGGSVETALESKLSNLPELVSAKLDDHLAKVAADLGNTANSAFEKAASRRHAARMSAFILAVFVTFILAGGYGYMIGRETTDADASKWSALVNLPDGGTWLALAKQNDITRAMAQSCAPGERRAISGGQVCDLTLYVKAPVATSKGTDAIRLSLSEYAVRLGEWGILGVGAVIGLIVGRLSKRSRKA
jgi:hypothetical protein